MKMMQWPRLIPALRATAAAVTALVVAHLLRLENPYWAAMTALIVVQPTRTLLFEKSYYRLAGTALGSIGAVAMVLGVAAAWIGYTFLVPVNPTLRMRSLLAAIAKDISRMSAQANRGSRVRVRGKLQHRVLRLVALARNFDITPAAVVSGAIAVLVLTASIERLREKLEYEELSPQAARQLLETLDRIARMAQTPAVESRLLQVWADELSALLEPSPTAVEADRAPSEGAAMDAVMVPAT